MILDRIQNWGLYFAKESRIGKAMHFLSREMPPDQPDGRVELDGERMFALIQTYRPRPAEKCRFESHRIYLDIQYILAGAETIGWIPTHELQVEKPYNREKDIAFYHDPERWTSLEVYEGSFAVFYPGDAHQPGVALPDYPKVKKVVVKIQL